MGSIKLLDILTEIVDSDIRFEIQSELTNIISKYESMGMDCWIYLKGNDAIEINSIRIKDKVRRRQGVGSSLMGEITALCDKYNLLCVLTPESTETPKIVLMRFYGGFGFKNNIGKNKDFRFRSSMIRYPQKI